MPSLLAPFRTKKKDDEKTNEREAASREPAKVAKVAPPPAYAAAPGNGESSIDTPYPPPALPDPKDVDVDVDISAAFSNLTLDSKPKDPDVNTCLAHLKLLFAIQALKEDVGYTDGLWNLWDSRADLDSELQTLDTDGAYPPGFRAQDATREDKQKLYLSKIREKRWALFVARAVDRYEAWWASLPQVQLREADMTTAASTNYEDFVDEKNLWPWTTDTLPPLDVLMV